MSTATANKELDSIATNYYQNQEEKIKQDFLDSIDARFKESIKQGEKYIAEDKPLQTLDEHFKEIDKL